MKNLTRITLFLPLLILLTACPYESTVPISDAGNSINKKLIGNWYKEGEMDKEFPSEYYKISEASAEGNKNRYRIVKLELNSEDNSYKKEVYISHLSVLKDKADKSYRFLNMRKDDSYYLHRIKLNEKRFILYELTDNIDEKFDSSDDLQKFVKKNMHLSFFYNKDEVTYYKGDHKK